MGKRLKAVDAEDQKVKGMPVLDNGQKLVRPWAEALNELWAASFTMGGWNAFNMRKDGMAVKIMVKLKDTQTSEWYTHPDQVKELAQELRDEYMVMFPSHSLEEMKAIRDQIDAARVELEALKEERRKAMLPGMPGS